MCEAQSENYSIIKEGQAILEDIMHLFCLIEQLEMYNKIYKNKYIMN